MPSGKNHEIINITVLMVILAGLYYFSTWQKNEIVTKYLDTYTIMVFSACYLFATFFLSPDLDTKSRPYKRWKILRILWWPYRIMFKHRGYSHNLVLGPLSIILNLVLIAVVIILLTGVEVKDIPLKLAVAIIVGIVLSIDVHIISDSLVSKTKHVFK
ncbi:metal-binding protein [uncultured Methanomethylovorans sp.]|uniref:metal-binding protein n=1 Tax=uncultured Methanomethylovorans sp. TaxID=183759 RepID=UPI002AA73837|nr:metal-binding protein [uncultured Methanomethylovorans sp.]